MGHKATLNYMKGVSTNTTSLKNMYICGAGIVAFLRILFATSGIIGSVWIEDYGSAVGFIYIIIDTYLPFFISITSGIVSSGEMIFHFILYVVVGVGYSGLKYDLAT